MILPGGGHAVVSMVRHAGWTAPQRSFSQLIGSAGCSGDNDVHVVTPRTQKLSADVPPADVWPRLGLMHAVCPCGHAISPPCGVRRATLANEYGDRPAGDERDRPASDAAGERGGPGSPAAAVAAAVAAELARPAEASDAGRPDGRAVSDEPAGPGSSAGPGSTAGPDSTVPGSPAQLGRQALLARRI